MLMSPRNERIAHLIWLEIMQENPHDDAEEIFIVKKGHPHKIEIFKREVPPMGGKADVIKVSPDFSNR